MKTYVLTTYIYKPNTKQCTGRDINKVTLDVKEALDWANQPNAEFLDRTLQYHSEVMELD